MICQSSYPWNLSDAERNLTEQDVKEMLLRYVAVLTDELVVVDHQSVPNGG